MDPADAISDELLDFVSNLPTSVPASSQPVMQSASIQATSLQLAISLLQLASAPETVLARFPETLMASSTETQVTSASEIMLFSLPETKLAI